MPIHSRRILCHGVNAHLHSVLQNRKRGWQTFHGKHIGYSVGDQERIRQVIQRAAAVQSSEQSVWGYSLLVSHLCHRNDLHELQRTAAKIR